MKSLSTKLRVTLAAVALTFIGNEIVWGAEWKSYGTNEQGSYFYETESMTHLAKNIVRLNVKSIYTEEGISHWVSGGGKEFQNLELSLIWADLNCAEKSVRYLSIVFYSKNGEVFYPINNDEWHFFAPDSMFGTLLEEICK
jgi:hypothetical protein